MKICPKDTCIHEQSVKTWIGNLYHNANKCDSNHHHVQLGAFYRYELPHNSLKQHGNHNMGISVCYERPWYVLTNFAFHQFDNHKYHKHNSSLHCYFSCELYIWVRPELSLLQFSCMQFSCDNELILIWARHDLAYYSLALA